MLLLFLMASLNIPCAPQESSDIESLPEEARALLLDKDALMNALQVRQHV